MSIKDYSTAGEMPHRCPVCGETYVPDRDSMELETVAPMEARIGGVGCIKSTRRFARIYAHDADRHRS